VLKGAPKEVARLVIQELDDLLLAVAVNLFRLTDTVKAKMAGAGMEKVFYEIVYGEVLDTAAKMHNVLLRAILYNMVTDAKTIEAVVAVYKRYM